MTEKGIPENLIPNADVDGNDILPVLFSPQITVIPSSAISTSLFFAISSRSFLSKRGTVIFLSDSTGIFGI